MYLSDSVFCNGCGRRRAPWCGACSCWNGFKIRQKWWLKDLAIIYNIYSCFLGMTNNLILVFVKMLGKNKFDGESSFSEYMHCEGTPFVGKSVQVIFSN